MKALSIKQPWASLICSGMKTVEIRGWHPSGSLLPLRLGIVSSLKDSDIAPTYQDYRVCPCTPWPRGVLLGSVLVSCVIRYWWEKDFLDDQKKHLNPVSCFKQGLYGWVLEDLELLPEPMPVTGRLRLFDIPDNLIREWVGDP